MADVDLNLVSDTREAQAQYGTEMPDAIERMVEALDEVERAGDDAASGLESGFRDILEGAGEATEAVEDLGEEGSNATVSVRAIGTTAKQVFEGDFTGAANAAVGLLRGFGPAAVIGGTAAAAGISLITAALDGAKAEAEEMSSAISKAYQKASADGRSFLTEAEIQAIALETIFDTEKREDARAEAERINVDLQTYIRAQAGDQEALNLVLERTNQLIRERQEELKFRPADIQTGLSAADADQTLFALNRIREENEAIATAHADAATAAALYRDVVDEAGTRVAAVADRLDQLPRETIATVTVDTSSAEETLKNLGKKRIQVPVDLVTPQGRVIR